MSKHYPRHPGSVEGSATSAAAADAIAGIAESLADWCENWFRHHTEHGRLKTCEECEIAAQDAGMLGKHQTISARIRTDLFLKRKCVYKIGTTEKGERVMVFDDSSTAGLKRTAKGNLVFETRATTSGRQAWLYGWKRRRGRPDAAGQ